MQRYENLLVAILMRIESELDRLCWNKFQKQLESPFLNTGETYSNDTFTVRAYYWGDDEELKDLPNFEYPGIKIWWYKHYGRGMEWEFEEKITVKFLADMLNDCIASLRRDFGEKGEK